MLIPLKLYHVGFNPTNDQGDGIFASAMSDLSPLWVGARCEGSMDASKCTGTGTCTNCIGRMCPFSLLKSCLVIIYNVV